MRRTTSYDRFDPVTVRAATRIARMQRMGRVTRLEAMVYFQQLASMEPHGGPYSYRSLRRLAMRRSMLSGTGVAGNCTLTRRSLRAGARIALSLDLLPEPAARRRVTTAAPSSPAR